VWVLSDEDRAELLLSLTGLTPDVLREGLGDRAVQSAVLAEVDPGDIGKASGLFQTLRQLGGVLGVAVAATVFAHAGGYGSTQQFSGGFAQALMACALLSLAGAAVALRLRGKAPLFIQPTGAKV
jgi:hypothetical protein